MTRWTLAAAGLVVAAILQVAFLNQALVLRLDLLLVVTVLFGMRYGARDGFLLGLAAGMGEATLAGTGVAVVMLYGACGWLGGRASSVGFLGWAVAPVVALVTLVHEAVMFAGALWSGRGLALHHLQVVLGWTVLANVLVALPLAVLALRFLPEPKPAPRSYALR